MTGSHLISDFARRIDRKRIGQCPFVVVANNCWGGEVYRYLGAAYNSPFIGLFMYPRCFWDAVEDLVSFVQKPLTFACASRYSSAPCEYPIGLIGTSEIHFMHYASQAEAAGKWHRRAARMAQHLQNGAQVCLKSCERDGATSSDLDRFHALAAQRRVSFGTSLYPRREHIRLLPHDAPDGKVPDGSRLFPVSLRYFDLVEWLKTGRIHQTFTQRMLAFWRQAASL